MACLCLDSFHSAASAWWHPPQASLPIYARAGAAPLVRRASGKGNPPSAKSPNVSPPIVRAVTAANAAIRGFDFHERSGGAWASSVEASAGILAGLNVGPRLDG